MSASSQEKAIDDILEGYQAQMAEDLCRLIRCPSVLQEAQEKAPFGEGIANALDFILNLSEEWGFSTQNLEGYVGIADYGDQEEQVGVLCHIDVVPPGKGWEYTPFGGDMDRGMVFGRGAIDNKGPMIACLYAMRAIKDSGLPLKKRLRHIIGTDEETGFRCMDYFTKSYQPPQIGFVPDGFFPLIYAEKGIIHFNFGSNLPEKQGDLILSHLKAGVAVNVIPDEAQAFIKSSPQKQKEIQVQLDNYPAKSRLKAKEAEDGLQLMAYGKCAHGSLPQEGINAISILLGFLKELPFETSLKSLLNTFYILACEDHHGRGLNIELADESGPLTLAPTLLKLGEKGLEMGIDIRFPISYSPEQMKEKISASLAKAGLELWKWQAKPPHHVEKDSYLVKTLLSQYQKYTGDNSPPIAMGGGTYARTMKNFVAFGPVMPGQTQIAHQADEYITIEHLLTLSKIYAGALYNLAK